MWRKSNQKNSITLHDVVKGTTRGQYCTTESLFIYLLFMFVTTLIKAKKIGAVATEATFK